MKELLYTEHAVKRMLERKISTEVINDIVKSFDGKILQTCDKEILYKKIKNRDDNLIAIILVQNTEILTVMNNFEIKIKS